MNTLFLVALIIETLFAIGFLVIPAALMAPFGVTLDVVAAAAARLFGAALISLPILLWLARKSDNMEFRIAVAYADFAYFLLSTIIILFAQLEGLMNPIGWSLVALHVVMTAWFGYFLVKKAR